MTSSIRLMPLCVLLIGLSLSQSGCRGCGCSEEPWLAFLKESQGSVERDFAATVKQWQSAAIDDRFVVGDGIRAGKTGTAVLRLNEGSLARLNPGTTIRFATGMPGKKQAAFTVETGTAELIVQSDGFELNTGIGTARISRGTRLEIRSDGGTTGLEVLIGNARFTALSGEEINLAAGESIDIEIGTATFERPAATADSASIAAESPPVLVDTSLRDTESDSAPGPADSETPSASRNTAPFNSPARADFALHAGSSIVVHSPIVPVAIELRTKDRCPVGAEAIIVGGKALGRGNDGVNLLFHRGPSTYQIFCVSAEGKIAARPVADGKITVLEDAGTRRLPRSAPTSNVDADGRTYRIMYANQLPSVLFRWPGAPAAAGYELSVISSGGTRTLATHRPEYQFKSGELKEGTHRMKFTVPGTAGRSRTTTLTLAFENSAPKASIREPENAAFDGEQSVAVSGTALPGWTATVKNGSIDMDNQGRFFGKAGIENGYRAMVIQLMHPKGGVHYYLRYPR